MLAITWALLFSLLATPVEPPPLPDPPERLAEAPQRLVVYLNRNPLARRSPAAARAALAPAVTAWAGEYQPIYLADLDADEHPELITLLGDGANNYLPVVFTHSHGRWRAHPWSADWQRPRLLTVAPITNAELPEIVLTESICGAHSCETRVSVARFKQGKFMVVEPQPSLTSAKVQLVPRENGQDIALTGGIVQSVGAGLQRERREFWRYVDGQFRVVRIDYEDSPALYYKVFDAVRFVREKQLQLAEKALTEALTGSLPVTDPRFGPPEGLPGQREALEAVAQIWLTEARLRQGQKVTAPPLDHPWVKGYWAEVQGEKGSCVAAVAATPELLAPLNQFGYANPQIGPREVCPP